MTFSVSVDGHEVPIEMFHEEPQPYPAMEYEWAPAFAKKHHMRDHPINHKNKPTNKPKGNIIQTVLGGANITPV